MENEEFTEALHPEKFSREKQSGRDNEMEAEDGGKRAISRIELPGVLGIDPGMVDLGGKVSTEKWQKSDVKQNLSGESMTSPEVKKGENVIEPPQFAKLGWERTMMNGSDWVVTHWERRQVDLIKRYSGRKATNPYECVSASMRETLLRGGTEAVLLQMVI
ncbi:uncharacterized protein [Henckelia pumila]|uniref:uncharacterized protein n=1 Tax=Henckelia pumila TaxID=405737 RepID=UPI003C6DF6D2